MRIYLLLAEDPFYTLPLVKSIAEDKNNNIVGAGFPNGFINAKRIPSTFLMYGWIRFIKTVFTVLFWKMKNGGKVFNYIKSKGIDVRYVGDVNSREFVQYLRTLSVDLIISNNCPQKLNKKLLNIPDKGAINLHLGLLPEYRGVFPIFHALINDESKIGVTVHYMDENFDNGDILLQKHIIVEYKENMFDIYPKAFKLGAELLVKAIKNIEDDAVERKQNGPSGASYFSYPTFNQIMKYRQKYK